MSKQSDRPSKGWDDLLAPIETTTSTEEIYNAIALTQRLRDDGLAYFKRTANARERWVRGCNDLLNLINAFRNQIHSNKSNALSVLGKFTREYDHTENRLRDIVFCDEVPEANRIQAIACTLGMLRVIYNFSARSVMLEYKGKTGNPIIIRERVNLTFTG